MGCNWSKRFDLKDPHPSSYYLSNESDSDCTYEIDQVFEATPTTTVLYVDAATSPFWSQKSAGVNVSAGEIPDWEGTGDSFGNEIKDQQELLEDPVKEIDILPISSSDSIEICHANTSPFIQTQSISEHPWFKSLTKERSRELSNVLECRICSKPAIGYCINCRLKRLCKECYENTHNDENRHVLMLYKITDKIDIFPFKKNHKHLLE